MRDVIDGNWIKKNLPAARGSKAALARAMGISTDMLTKILSGTRNVQPAELPGLLDYFGLQLSPVPVRDDALAALIQFAASLNDAGRDILLQQAAALASSPALLTSDEVPQPKAPTEKSSTDQDAP